MQTASEEMRNFASQRSELLLEVAACSAAAAALWVVAGRAASRRRAKTHPTRLRCVTKLAITETELVDPEATGVRRATLLVEDGLIAGTAAPEEALGGDWRRIPRAGLAVAPGFI